MQKYAQSMYAKIFRNVKICQNMRMCNNMKLFKNMQVHTILSSRYRERLQHPVEAAGNRQSVVSDCRIEETQIRNRCFFRSENFDRFQRMSFLTDATSTSYSIHGAQS